MPHFSKITFIVTLFSSFGLSMQAASAQEFYKWVDSQGSTHYTTTPPPKNAKKLATVDTYGTRQPSQVKTPAPNPNVQNNNATQLGATMDAQQQEANAALEQGRNKR